MQSSEAEVTEEKSAGIQAEISATDADASAELKFSVDWTQTEAKKDGKVIPLTDYDYKRWAGKLMSMAL